MNSPSHPFDTPLRRHQLVTVVPAAWDRLLSVRADLADEPLLREWVPNGWPLVVRRPLPGEGEGIPLGLPLPPWAGKRRIALQINGDDIEALMPLPALPDVFDTAPEAWKPCLRELIALALRYDVDARVFGSLAWQWLTGLNYVAPGSDVDLTWTVPRRHRIGGFLDELAALDARAPVRIDGEVLRADGAGANWRELHAGGEIALKTANDVVLVTQHAFLGAFA